mmetsp:Transcript_23675/g.74444  ORF Transcript_23675/g.74444 Transcript_23675/m.74444 type:complete len:356 (+) Transcript_23675:916-1983(+)
MEVLRVDPPASDLVVRDGPQRAHDFMDGCLLPVPAQCQSPDILQHIRAWLVTPNVMDDTMKYPCIGPFQPRAVAVEHREVLAREASDVDVEVARYHSWHLRTKAVRGGVPGQQVAEQGRRQAIPSDELPRCVAHVAGEAVVHAEPQAHGLRKLPGDLAQRKDWRLSPCAISAEAQAPGADATGTQGRLELTAELCAHVAGPRCPREALPPWRPGWPSGRRRLRSRDRAGGRARGRWRLPGEQPESTGAAASGPASGGSPRPECPASNFYGLGLGQGHRARHATTTRLLRLPGRLVLRGGSRGLGEGQVWPRRSAVAGLRCGASRCNAYGDFSTLGRLGKGLCACCRGAVLRGNQQ